MADVNRSKSLLVSLWSMAGLGFLTMCAVLYVKWEANLNGRQERAALSCQSWISEEYFNGRDARVHYVRRQGEELVFRVSEIRSGDTHTCVYNLNTNRMLKPSVFNQSYN